MYLTTPLTVMQTILPVALSLPVLDYYNSKLSRRDDFPRSDVTYSDHKIFWGCNVDPVAELDHLSDVCKTSGQCVEGSEDFYEREIDYLDLSQGGNPGKPQKKKLKIRGSGRYEIPLRNGLVKAIQDAANGKDIIKWHRNVHWSWQSTCTGHECFAPGGSGTCDIAEFTTVIGLNHYIKAETPSDNSIQAQISIEGVDSGKGFCNGLDYAAAISGGLGPVGGVGAAFFGTLKASCGG